MQKTTNFYIREKNSVVLCCTTKEVFKTNYENGSPILFLVLKKLIFKEYQM